MADISAAFDISEAHLMKDRAAVGTSFGGLALWAARVDGQDG